MNTMQKITVTVVLLWVALLLAVPAAGGLEARYWLGVVVVAVVSGIVGTLLVVVFARGTVIARLQRGTVVFALAVSGLALAVPIVPDRYVPGWQRRLAQYAELHGDTAGFGQMSSAMAMYAVDSLISEHLLANQPGLWRDYGEYVVACARRHTVPVETVVAVMQRETTVLRWCSNPLLGGWVEPAQQREAHRRYFAKLTDRELISMYDSLRRERPLDSVVANVVWEAKSGRRRIDTYAAPADAWVPNWPARLALACSILLASLAIVVVLGLLRRKPKKAV
jgi:hypothetical protein